MIGSDANSTKPPPKSQRGPSGRKGCLHFQTLTHDGRAVIGVYATGTKPVAESLVRPAQRADPRRTEMSEALDAGARAIALLDEQNGFGSWDFYEATGSQDYQNSKREQALVAIYAFLDAVENSQQPISHDAMQTLRKHLEPKQ